MAWGDPRWYHNQTQRLLDRLQMFDANWQHVDLREPAADDLLLEGRALRWKVDSNYVVWAPVDKVWFMEGNQWSFPHARALYEAIERGDNPVFELPAARLYRITPEVVADTQRLYEQDDLEYEYDMEKPWTGADAGTFRVQLLDGNHRALAAIAAGERQIPVVVGENYRADVLPDEWVYVEPPKPVKKKRASRKRRAGK